MHQVAITTGAALIGWIFPEFFFLLSPHADSFKRLPYVMNLVSAAGFALIAYGVSA